MSSEYPLDERGRIKPQAGCLACKSRSNDHKQKECTAAFGCLNQQETKP